MLRPLLLTAALVLAACAASPGTQPDLAFALGADLSCNASEMRRCPAGGCTAGEPGEALTIPISLHVPDRGGAGRFCIATGCENAQFGPTLTRAQGWTATVRADDRTADLEIARDLRTFTLREANSSGVSAWSGECSPAGS